MTKQNPLGVCVFPCVCFKYQKLRGAQQVESEWLDPGVVDTQLSVDARALYTGQDA